MEKQAKEKAIREAVKKCPYKKECILTMIDKIKNPYPEDIFPEIKERSFPAIRKMFKRYSLIPLDRLSAHLMRLARNNLKEELKQEVRNSSQA